MDQILQNLDIYNIASTILSIILAALIPAISCKYKKIKVVLLECKKLVKITLDACEDEKITPEELKQILKQLDAIMDVIKKDK